MKQLRSTFSLTTAAPICRAALALVFLALAGLPHAEAATPWYKKHLGTQFTSILRSDLPEVREDALVTLISLAQQEGHYLRSTTPTLLGMYQHSRSVAERKMAATALCLLGDEARIEDLVRLSNAELDRDVQRHTRRAIATYYLGAYPELAGPALQSKRLSHKHIQQAKRQLARAHRTALATDSR